VKCRFLATALVVSLGFGHIFSSGMSPAYFL
jgi:hypothetical protein